MHAKLLIAVAAIVVATTSVAQQATFTTTADFAAGTFDQVSGLVDDQLTLGRNAVSTRGLVWSDNWVPGYVVKMDAATGQQLGRYDSALASAGVSTEPCNGGGKGGCPGRIAADKDGNAWVVNRAFMGQGSVTKIAASITDCVDRNLNGVIDTSADLNADGLISVLPADGEYLGQADECILTTIQIGAVGDVPRAVAVDRYGQVWVGTFHGRKLYRIEPVPPYTVSAPLPVNTAVYALAAAEDWVYLAHSGNYAVYRVNVLTDVVEVLDCPGWYGTYGVVAEPGTARAWYGSYFLSNSTGVLRADFDAGTCVTFPGEAGSMTVAPTVDLAGNIWVGDFPKQRMRKYSSAGASLGQYSVNGTPHGTAVDFTGAIWSVIDSPPGMAKLNPDTGAVIGVYSLGGPGVTSPTPYNYSDFTGAQLDRDSPWTTAGSWTATYDGGAAGIPWRSVSWNSEAAGSVPASTAIAVQVRAAEDAAALALAPWVPATSGAPLTGITGRLVQVQASLSGPGFVTPVLSDLTVAGPCTIVGDACCLSPANCDDGDAGTIDACPAVGGACTHTQLRPCDVEHPDEENGHHAEDHRADGHHKDDHQDNGRHLGRDGHPPCGPKPRDGAGGDAGVAGTTQVVQNGAVEKLKGQGCASGGAEGALGSLGLLLLAVPRIRRRR